jgi:hypothetical protein
MNVRLCIANGALCSERTSCTRSGWRKPAVVRRAESAVQTWSVRKTRRHCECVTEPRRADAPRSCEEKQKRCFGRLRCMKANHSDRSSRHFRVLNLYQVYRKPRRLHWYNSPGKFCCHIFPLIPRLLLGRPVRPRR